jgi:hypothetical protein
MDFDNDPKARRAQRINPENLKFTINGATFHVISGYAPDAPGDDALTEWRAMDPDVSDADFAALADRTILRFLKPGQEQAWHDARRVDADNPITGFDLVDIVHWLIEAVVARPLELPSDSSTGSMSPATGSPPGGAIARPLTVVSPSPEGKASAR